MEFDIEAYKQLPSKKREVIRKFKDKINESSDSNISFLSASNKKDIGTKDKIEEFFKTQRRINSMVDVSPRTFLKKSRVSEDMVKTSAKKTNKFEEMLNGYFSGIQLGNAESENKRALENLQNGMILKTPYKSKVNSTRTGVGIGKSPILAFKEQYYNQKSEMEDRRDPLSSFQAERSFLNKPGAINSGRAFDICRRLETNTKYPGQYTQKLTHSDIQNFQKKIDSMTNKEIANLPTK